MEIKNIALWAKLKKEYTVDEAACLVCDQEPGTVGVGDPCHGIVQGMKDQLEDDGCCATVNTDYVPNEDWRGVPTGTMLALNSKKIVTRERLKAWCAANDHWPKVFFPDESTKEELAQETPREADRKETDKPLSETERGKLLAILLGMAMDKYKYDPSPEIKRKAVTGENHGSIHYALKNNNLSVDSDTIRKYLEEAAQRYPEAKPRKS